MPLAGHEPTQNTQPNKWCSYANAGDFTVNMVIPFVIIFCGLLLVLAINAVIILCALRRRELVEDSEKQTRAEMEQTTLPSLIFSAETKLTGAETEFAICLADFVEGDGILMLPVCNHCFHVQCIARWLTARRSCPTCRVICPLESQS